MMLENVVEHQLQTLMLLGDGTHSQGDPDPTHLNFTQKSSVGEDGENPEFHTHQGSSKKMKMMSALPC
jgi:hypothetical protein